MGAMYHSIFHSIALILSASAIIMFVHVSKKLKGKTKTSYILISFGILISVTIHSLVEHLEATGYFSIETLLMIMPVLVAVGSVFLILGAYVLVKGK